jgi:hypothetical protein
MPYHKQINKKVWLLQEVWEEPARGEKGKREGDGK